MPLNKKGNRILHKMQGEYGGKKGKSVFYASRNKGTITAVDPESTAAVKKKRAVRGIRYSKA